MMLQMCSTAHRSNSPNIHHWKIFSNRISNCISTIVISVLNNLIMVRCEESYDYLNLEVNTDRKSRHDVIVLCVFVILGASELGDVPKRQLLSKTW